LRAYRSDWSDGALGTGQTSLAAFAGEAPVAVPSGFARQALRSDRPDLTAVAALALQATFADGAVTAWLAVPDVMKSRTDFTGELML
jgi:hypothetical protein